LILKKQKQEIESFEVEVEGEKEKIEDHSIYKNIVLHFKIKGKVDLDKAERAVKLSMDKYCSVSMILSKTANITYKVSVN
jgi:putative redox protein